MAIPVLFSNDDSSYYGIFSKPRPSYSDDPKGIFRKKIKQLYSEMKEEGIKEKNRMGYKSRKAAQKYLDFLPEKYQDYFTVEEYSYL